MAHDLHAELARLLRQLLLQLEQVPVLSHATQHMVEKVVEVLAKRVADMYNVVSQGNLVLREVLADLVLDNALA